EAGRGRAGPRRARAGGRGRGRRRPGGWGAIAPPARARRPAAAPARRGLVRHARGRAGGRPLMIFAAQRSALGTRSPLRARVPLLAAGVTAVAVCAAGCGSGGFNGIYSLPLPGGANLGPHPYQVTAEFSNV